PWHCHGRGRLPVSEHRERDLTAGKISDKVERNTGEPTTQIRAQFRACGFAFGAWIASSQDVPPRHWARPQPNCTAEGLRGFVRVRFPPKRCGARHLSISARRTVRPYGC